MPDQWQVSAERLSRPPTTILSRRGAIDEESSDIDGCTFSCCLAAVHESSALIRRRAVSGHTRRRLHAARRMRAGLRGNARAAGNQTACQTPGMTGVINHAAVITVGREGKRLKGRIGTRTWAHYWGKAGLWKKWWRTWKSDSVMNPSLWWSSNQMKQITNRNRKMSTIHLRECKMVTVWKWHMGGTQGRDLHSYLGFTPGPSLPESSTACKCNEIETTARARDTSGI